MAPVLPVPADWPFGDTTDWLPLGSDHYAFLLYKDQILWAVLFVHREPHSYVWCGGAMGTPDSDLGAKANITTDPLEVAGDVVCLDCGDSGAVIAGRWKAKVLA